MTFHPDIVSLLARVDTTTLVDDHGRIRSAPEWCTHDGRTLTPGEVNALHGATVDDLLAAATIMRGHGYRLIVFAATLDPDRAMEIEP